MLRNVFIDELKAVRANIKAHADLVTGMGVVLDDASTTTAFPSATTSANIFVIDKLRAGALGFNYLPDSADEFNKIKAGEMVKCRKMTAGEMFDTDQVASTAPAAGNIVGVGTDGKWAVMSSGSSIYRCVGVVSDAGKTMYRIEVLDTAEAAAAG